MEGGKEKDQPRTPLENLHTATVANQIKNERLEEVELWSSYETVYEDEEVLVIFQGNPRPTETSTENNSSLDEEVAALMAGVNLAPSSSKIEQNADEMEFGVEEIPAPNSLTENGAEIKGKKLSGAQRRNMKRKEKLKKLFEQESSREHEFSEHKKVTSSDVMPTIGSKPSTSKSLAKAGDGSNKALSPPSKPPVKRIRDTKNKIVVMISFWDSSRPFSLEEYVMIQKNIFDRLLDCKNLGSFAGEAFFPIQIADRWLEFGKIYYSCDGAATAEWVSETVMDIVYWPHTGPHPPIKAWMPGTYEMPANVEVLVYPDAGCGKRSPPLFGEILNRLINANKTSVCCRDWVHKRTFTSDVSKGVRYQLWLCRDLITWLEHYEYKLYYVDTKLRFKSLVKPHNATLSPKALQPPKA